MNDEIREILNNIKEQSKEENWIQVSPEFIQPLLDCITNLQQKLDMYENPDDMTLFYMWLDEKAKDKIKNLQKENERLKERLLQEKKDFKETNDYAFKLLDYKSRIDKAVEYIKQHCYFDDGVREYMDVWEVEHLLNILQNGSESE